MGLTWSTVDAGLLHPLVAHLYLHAIKNANRLSLQALVLYPYHLRACVQGLRSGIHGARAGLGMVGMYVYMAFS